MNTAPQDPSEEAKRQPIVPEPEPGNRPQPEPGNQPKVPTEERPPERKEGVVSNPDFV